MALYEGESLKKRLDRGRLPIGEVVDIAIQVAEGLERAHTAEILHRDIKPANLMLTGHDEVVIVDFGLAKLAGDFTLTKPGSSLGTPHYMSPEQSRGQPLDPRTDLWSLGVVLYEMLTGERPFAGENHTSVARAILDDEVPEIRKLRPDASPELGAIVAKALEKDADRRYQSAGQILDDLRGLRSQMSEFEGLTLSAPSQTPGRRRSPLVPMLVAAALILGAAAVLWFLRSGGFEEPGDVAPPRIVVLPFENLGSPEDEYFADGITEEITARVASISGLEVVSRTSAVQYAGSDKTIEEMGEELGVGFVLEGSVRWARDDEASRIRITPRLIRVKDDTNLWTESYDRILDDVFEIQSEIAQNVTDHLGITMSGGAKAETDHRPTDNLDAYQAFLRGRYYATRPHFTYENWDRAMTAYQQAVDLDPDFALAHAHLARGHALLRYFRHDLTPARLQAADDAAARALELGPDLARVRLALGFYHLWAYRDVENALKEFARSDAIQPDNAEILDATGSVFFIQGRWEEALGAYRRAFELSPREAEPIASAGWVLWTIRRYPEAIAAADQAINLAPDSVWPYLYKAFAIWSWEGSSTRTRAALEALPAAMGGWERWAWYWQEVFDGRYRDALGHLNPASDDWIHIKILARPDALFAAQAHTLLGEFDRANELFDRAREILEPAVEASPQDPSLRSSLGIAYAALGRKEEAIREGIRATELLPKSVDGFYYLSYAIDLAHIYTIVGEDEAALDQIEHLLSNPSWISTPWLEMDPRWDSLCDHPRFQALLEEYGPE